MARSPRERTARIALAAGCAAGSVGVAWSVGAGANALGAQVSQSESVWHSLPRAVLFWPFQSMAAAPNRIPGVPIVVFVALLAAVAVLCALGVRASGRRVAAALGFVVAASYAVAIASTIAAWNHGGLAWQGRYDLPFALGHVLVAGYGANLAGVTDRAAPALVLLVSRGAYMPAVLGLLHEQRAISPLSGTPEWFTAPTAVVGGVACVGGLVWAVATMASPTCCRRRRGDRDDLKLDLDLDLDGTAA